MNQKASQRRGAKQLGAHLLKTTDNERVEIHEVRGFISEDVMDAMHKAYPAATGGRRCELEEALSRVSRGAAARLVDEWVTAAGLRREDYAPWLTDAP